MAWNTQEFLVSVVLIGSIIQPVLRWITKQLWLWFVHSSEHLIKIWYTAVREHHKRRMEDADEILRRSIMP